MPEYREGGRQTISYYKLSYNDIIEECYSEGWAVVNIVDATTGIMHIAFSKNIKHTGVVESNGQIVMRTEVLLPSSQDELYHPIITACGETIFLKGTNKIEWCEKCRKMLPELFVAILQDR